MIQSAPGFRPLAARLLGHEAAGQKEAPELTDAAERICGKLYGELAPLIGIDGLTAIVAHALHLVQAEFPFLRGAKVERQPEDCLKGLRESAQGLEPAELRRGIVAFLASVVWLLATFIGEAMVLRLIARAWPDVSLDNEGQGSQEVMQ